MSQVSWVLASWGGSVAVDPTELGLIVHDLSPQNATRMLIWAPAGRIAASLLLGTTVCKGEILALILAKTDWLSERHEYVADGPRMIAIVRARYTQTELGKSVILHLMTIVQN